MADAQFPLVCPFCQFVCTSEYKILLHIESLHTEDSPFVIKEEKALSDFNPLDYGLGNGFEIPEGTDGDTYVTCPEVSCEEPVLLMELQNHLDFHAAERLSMHDVANGVAVEEPQRGESSVRRSRSSSGSVLRALGRKEKSKVGYLEHSEKPEKNGKSPKLSKKKPLYELLPPKDSWKLEKSALKAPYKNGIKRLGKSDLGPYANERQMPDWLREKLEKGGDVSILTTIDPTTGTLVKTVSVANETPDLVPVLALLCERDPNVAQVWLCHPGVKHVGKQIKGEGGFCGYRNIQMVVSYIQAAYPNGSHPFEGRIPTILKLQDWIEEGWDKGINATARLETGGVKGTRKYIGTSEAQTLFTNVGIPCRPRSFNRSEGLQTQKSLLEFVYNYFQARGTGDIPRKVTRTSLPPIYFQHSGHSMTIIGIERKTDGTLNLLVLDPFFTPSAPIKNMIGVKGLRGRVDTEPLMKAYRRKMDYLKKYKEFEVLVLEDGAR